MLLSALMLKKRELPYPGPHGSIKWKIDFSGYNTPNSRKSKDRWGYAQAAALVVFLKWGKRSVAAAVLASMLGAVLGIWNAELIRYTVYGGVGLGFLCVFAAFSETEKNIDNYFGA